MQDKKKKPKKQIKARDLKPSKDAKGGRKAGGDPPTAPGHRTTLPAVQRPGNPNT